MPATLAGMDIHSDIAALFYADFGVQAVHTPAGGGATTTALAILDQPGTEIVGGEILATDYTLRFPAASFPAVKRGDTFVIDGTTYSAREAAQPLLDGGEHIVPLARA